MNNGHYAGKIKKFIDRAVSKAKGTEGQLYKIMNAHGFYDVADENNGLTDWQRASVPEYNQHRISDLCDAIADMIGDMLSNDEYGILYPQVDDVVGKLDLNATKTAAEMNVIGGVLGGLTAGASETARQSMGQLTAILMGGFAFDPDILPPITLNLPNLPLSVATAYPGGSYPADWTFLYDHETVKSKTYYEADDGGIAIGANIKLNLGPSRQQILKLVFSVPNVDKNGMPEGDAVGGLTPTEFNEMYKISEKKYAALNDDEKKFELDATQMQLAYFRYIQLTLWGAIKNPDNWAYLHWGSLTHNSCPCAVKTAVCSFIHTNGFAVDPQSTPEAGFISYCVSMGMAYLTGRTKTVYMYQMPGMSYLNDKNEKIVVKEGVYGWSSSNSGVPVDKKLANLHFTLVADFLSHLTYDSNPNRAELRKQRVDEANLIYNYVGLPTIAFGSTAIPPELSANAMKKRGFEQLVNATIKVYENKNSTIPLSDSNFKYSFQGKVTGSMSQVTIQTLKYLCHKAGIAGVDISSLYRDNEKQGRVMFNELQENNGKAKTSRAKAGREVNNIFFENSKKEHNGQCLAIEDPALQQKTLNQMINKIEFFASQDIPVSNHGYAPERIQAVDVAPNGTKAKYHCSDADMRKFHVACYDAYQEGYLKEYLCPKEYGGPKVADPAFHIAIWQDDSHKHPKDFGGAPTPPTVDCKVLDENLKNPNTWDLVYVHDQVMV